MAYDRIYPGQVWLDTNGKPIQSHVFSVFYNEKDGLYYWYGENKEKTKGGLFNKVWHWGSAVTPPGICTTGKIGD